MHHTHTPTWGEITLPAIHPRTNSNTHSDGHTYIKFRTVEINRKTVETVVTFVTVETVEINRKV